MKQTAGFPPHRAAVEQRGPKILQSIYVILQAVLFAVVKQFPHGSMLHGVTIVTLAIHA